MTEHLLAEERRRNDSLVLALMRKIELDVGEMSVALKAHVGDEAAMLSKIMSQSFPDGDPIEHRKAHEAWIAKTEASAVFWKDMRTSLARWGLLGFAAWIAIIAWQAFLQGPQK